MSEKENYPLEYREGSVEFFYRKFFVNESVLIPRFETEDLVREAIRTIRKEKFDTLIDVGTGSGIIPISILAETDIPEGYALDLSSEALEVAKKNAGNLRVGNIRFLKSDLMKALLENDLPMGKNILIVTNPPYIKADGWENMSPDTRYEPEMALFGGKNTGFELYERLFSEIQPFLDIYRPERLLVLAEMGEDQEEIADRILNNYGWEHSFFPDAFGRRRFMRVDIL